MFQIGSQLYRLTRRDGETLQVEPYFRQVTGTLVSNAPAGSVVFPIPLDRAYYLHSAIWNAGGRPGSTYDRYSLEFYDSANVTLGQVFDNSVTTTIGSGFVIHQELGIIIPPQTSRLQMIFYSPAVVATATITGSIQGYLIPPGQIGRA